MGEILDAFTKAFDADRPDLLRTAGNRLEAELMKLHRNHHGLNCDTCQALIGWWNVIGR